MEKIMKVIFTNKIIMKFWMWRYNRKMAKFDYDKWLFGDEED